MRNAIRIPKIWKYSIKSAYFHLSKWSNIRSELINIIKTKTNVDIAINQNVLSALSTFKCIFIVRF